MALVDKYHLLVQNTPWSITNRQSIVDDVLTIYCGDANFAANPEAGQNVWMDLTTFYNVYSVRHNDDPNARLCRPGDLASTLDYLMVQNPNHVAGEQAAHIIVLCDGALVKGRSADSTGSQPSVSAINALTGRAGLYPGKLMDDIVYAGCVAFTLLHELMHVTQMSSCKWLSLALLYLAAIADCLSKSLVGLSLAQKNSMAG